MLGSFSNTWKKQGLNFAQTTFYNRIWWQQIGSFFSQSLPQKIIENEIFIFILI